MAGVNKVILVGNLGKDPEMRYTPNGVPVCSFPMATSDSYKDRNSGERVTQTEWHNIVIYGKLVDIVEKYVKKGDKLYIEGSITTRKWQDKEGNDRYNTEVKAFNMTMLGGTEKKSAQPAAVAAGGDDDLPF